LRDVVFGTLDVLVVDHAAAGLANAPLTLAAKLFRSKGAYHHLDFAGTLALIDAGVGTGDVQKSNLPVPRHCREYD